MIVSVPPALAGRIDYEPGVSVGRDQMTQRFAMGATVKVLVTYERAFWREAGYSGEVVSSDGPFSVVYDNTSHDGKQAALVGFIVLGLLLAYARLLSGGLYLSIGLHIGFVFALRVGRIVMEVPRHPGLLWGQKRPPLVSGVAGWAALLVCFGLVWLVRRKRSGRCIHDPSAGTHGPAF